MSIRRGRGPLAAATGLAAAAALVLPSLAAAATKADPRGNSLGIQVVRFAPGTTPDAMRAAVANAGADVVTDLSRIRALAVVPRNASRFAASIRKQRGVRAAWPDRVTAVPRAAGFQPDPLHDATSLWGETNPEGILQWDDHRNGVAGAWATTTGSPDVSVAVIDSGIQPSHKELRDNVVAVGNTIPCNRLNAIFGTGGLGKLHDCAPHDTDGHGTWVASRIAGAANGLGSNGIAPNVRIMGYKALATGFGGLTTWIVDAMVRACDADADVINMSLGGYDDPNDASFPKENADDYFLWQDAVDYCRKQGTAIVASAGNEHVRVERKTVTLTGTGETRTIAGAGVVTTSNEGINAFPGDTGLVKYQNDYRGMLETPAGVPGVIMVSATSNAIPDPAGNVLAQFAPPSTAIGTRDNLSYYSSYGPRVDIAAPGGARKYGVPKFDTRPGTDILYGGWGQLGAIDKTSDICSTIGGPADFACFEQEGAGFAWLQGTSMSSPEVAGVAALALSAKPALRESPDALATRLKSTARTGVVNHTGISSPSKDPAWDGTACGTGFCHVDWSKPISAADAYGAGIVNAAAAVR